MFALVTSHAAARDAQVLGRRRCAGLHTYNPCGGRLLTDRLGAI